MTAPGSTPWERHRSASETMIAKSTGSTTSGRPSSRSGFSARRTSTSDQSTCGARASAHSPILRANSSEVSMRPRHMPGKTEPCPGKRNTGRTSSAATPRTARTLEHPLATAVSGSSQLSPCGSRTARWAGVGHEEASEPAASREPAVPFSTCRRSRTAWSRRACPPGALRSHGVVIGTAARTGIRFES